MKSIREDKADASLRLVRLLDTERGMGMSWSVDETHTIYTELTLASGDAEQLADAALDWLAMGMVSALTAEPWRPGAVIEYAEMVRDVSTWRAASAIPDSAVAVHHWNEPSQERGIVPDLLPWLKGELRRRPVLTTLYLGGVTLSIHFSKDIDAFVKLGWEVGERSFAEPAVPAGSSGALQTLWYVASRYRPVFGHVSYGNLGGRTELERNLPRMVGNPYLTTPRWHEFLRGYSWWTLVPGELVDKLGGGAALEESRAFREILRLPGGGMWLRATESFAEYDMAAVEKVWSALHPVIIPGTPQPMKVRPGDPPNRLTVMASEV